MNEWLFFSHLTLVFLLTLGALRLGKGALFVWIALQSVLANLFVLKQITLFSLQATCSDVFILGCVLGQNFLQEFFGIDQAKRAIRIAFLSMVTFALLAKLHLLYEPSASDWTQQSFLDILSCSPRLLFASVATFLIVQQVDMRLFGWLKIRFISLHLVWRTSICLLTSQLLDTVLFSFLGLYGLVEQIGSIIAVSLTLKLIIAACSTPFTALARKVYQP